MKSFFTLLLSATYVAAHGLLHQVIIDGKPYLGNAPGASSIQSIIRTISTVDPVKGAANPMMNCGQNAKPAALVADAMPGSTVSFDWRAISLSNWFHNTGPMMTYMASCGDTTCDKFDSMQAKWFLIDRAGQDPNGTWVQDSLTHGAMATVRIPSNIAPGNYLVRHEIIALQLAVSVGGAEFYPACAQLRVGGSQSGKPSSGDLVSLPGAYKDTDPGIFDSNVYNPGSVYKFPGPQIASFIAGGGSSDNSGGSSDGSGSGTHTHTHAHTPSSSASSTRPPKSTSTSKTCRLRGGSDSTSNTSNSTTPPYARRALQFHRRYKPRSVSRVMRNVIFGEESQ